MKKYTLTLILSIGLIAIFGNQKISAQTCEWRYVNPTYSSVDPDGAGPATGSVTFTLQIHTITGSIPNVTTLAAGYGYQSSKLMLPAGTPCVSNPQPANTVMGPEFQGAGFTYNTVNHCNTLLPEESTGGQNFDRRASGTIESSTGITLTTTWTNIFTITMWTLGNTYPEGGYIMLNAGFNGTPTPVVSNWGVSDVDFNEYVVNSLTYTTPLPLGGTLPVLFSQFEAKCSNNGTAISWSTEQEANSAYFELERSINGTTWKTLGRTPAAGNSSATRKYSQLDLEAGNAMYRVKQVDRDGQFIYTNIERANCQVKNVSAVIYPVPAKDVLNVVIRSDKAVRTQLMVFEISGKLVKKLDANVQNGTNNFSIDLKGLTSGDYILKSSDAGIELNKQFTIIR